MRSVLKSLPGASDPAMTGRHSIVVGALDEKIVMIIVGEISRADVGGDGDIEDDVLRSGEGIVNIATPEGAELPAIEVDFDVIFVAGSVRGSESVVEASARCGGCTELEGEGTHRTTSSEGKTVECYDKVVVVVSRTETQALTRSKCNLSLSIRHFVQPELT